MVEPNALRLPTSLAEVDASWLQEVLAREHDRVELSSVIVHDVAQCFALTAHLRLEYVTAPPDLPSAMFIKCGFASDALSSLFSAAYKREVDYYRRLAHRVNLSQPNCYFTAADAAGRSVVLLEDVVRTRGAHFGSAATAMTVQNVTTALRHLAELHATWWAVPVLNDYELYPGSLRPVVETLLSQESWNRALARPSGQHIPTHLRDSPAAIAATRAAWLDNSHGPHCLIHGDVHPGNLFMTPDDDVGFVDWQATSRGSWAYDVTRLLVTALGTDDRRKHEADLIRTYLASLGEQGVDPPGWNAAWLSYRRNTVHGLRWLTSPINSYPEEYVNTYVMRTVAAVEDLDALAALDVS
jgi:hypothetical protein